MELDEAGVEWIMKNLFFQNVKDYLHKLMHEKNKATISSSFSNTVYYVLGFFLKYIDYPRKSDDDDDNDDDNDCIEVQEIISIEWLLQWGQWFQCDIDIMQVWVGLMQVIYDKGMMMMINDNDNQIME